MRTISALSVAVFVLIGCSGKGQTFVSEPPVTGQRFQSATIVEGASAPIEMSAADKADFAERLREELHKEGRFMSGNGLTITYRFVQYDEGIRSYRWFFPGLGEGTLAVEAEFSDQDGRRLGKITAQGRIGGGAMGGSIKNAHARAAEEIATYAAAHFR